MGDAVADPAPAADRRARTPSRRRTPRASSSRSRSPRSRPPGWCTASTTTSLYAGLRGSEVKVDPKLSRQRPDDARGCRQVNILWDADPDGAGASIASRWVPTPRRSTPRRWWPARCTTTSASSRSSSARRCRLEQACELAEAARLDRPELGVILLRHRVDVTDAQPGAAQRRARGRRRPTTTPPSSRPCAAAAT